MRARRWGRRAGVALALIAGPRLALAQADPSSLCRAAIASAELGTRIPDAFLFAIGRVESGRPDAGGRVAPWPWTVNALGQGRFFPSKQAAIEAVRALQQSGVRSIDVGCLQVNLAQHPGAFASLEQAFDPAANAAYAAHFLQTLFDQTGSWPHAAAAYHSQTPGLAEDYQRKVLAAWAIPDRPGEAAAPAGSGGDRGHAGAGAIAAVAPRAAMAALPGGGFARVMRLPGAGAGAGLGTGRDLMSYRLAPVRLATMFHPR